jgi:Tol biopolymer transport system component/DNA-binding winged helix-turn-helix (wHTH) protein
MSERVAIGNELDGRAARGNAPDFALGGALIQPSLNRISLHGRVTQVEPKVMHVLTLMAARPGAVVSRETFLEEVWAGRGGDDYLLNRAVSELRKVFGDDAQSPRYIETIRKAGYRLVAPIAPARVAEAVSDAPSAPTPERRLVEPAGQPDEAPASHGLYSRASSVFRASPLLCGGIIAGFAGAVVVGLTIASGTGRMDGRTRVAESYDVRPLTSFVGREYEPALSPDGSRVAFIWDGGADGAFDVYVKTVGSESVLNLTMSDSEESHPAWFADGRAVLFVRPDGQGSSIMRVSALGGGATLMLRDEAAADIRGVSLSPDGASIVYARRESAASPYHIVLAAFETGEKRIITSPEAGTLGDIDPLFAHDGRSVFFVRAVNEVTKDLYAASLQRGEPRRLTSDNRKINGLTWSPDGEKLLFTSTRAGMYGVWSVGSDGGDPQLVPLGNEDVQQPSTAPGVSHIAYEQWTHRAQLKRIELAQQAEIDAEDYVRSTRWDSNPAYAPDGERIAFTSNRAGPQGIWISDRDGRNAVQIADLGGVFVDHPAWSPDGRSIAFDASPDGRTAILTVAPEGGTPRRITEGPGDSRNPAWSRDGKWIYFESNQSGAWQIYARPAGGGKSVRVTTDGGVNPGDSVDGEWLLYSKPDAPGLWRRPVEDWRGSEAADVEEKLTGELELRDSSNWAPADDGVYFIRRPVTGPPVLSLFDYSSGSVQDIVELSPSFEGWGLDLAPDETEIILAEMLKRESDLRLATPRQPIVPSAETPAPQAP